MSLLVLLGLLLFSTGVYTFKNNQGAIELWVGAVVTVYTIHMTDHTSGSEHGNLLPRIAVLIKVDKFPADTLHLAGMEADWSADGAQRLRSYQFE